MSNLRQGVQVNQYRLVRPLGEGGMATVWLAEFGAGQLAALKFVSRNVTEVTSTRFMQEACIHRDLPRHENIAQWYGAGVSDAADAYYIAMEYCPGWDLWDIFATMGLDRRDSWSVSMDLLGALIALHHAGIIHRDIKPENLRCKRGKDGLLHAKLLDFGIAKAPDSKRLTAPGSFVGTPECMAPEVLRVEEATTRSDLYSAGSLLYWIFMKQPSVAGAGFNASFEILAGNIRLAKTGNCGLDYLINKMRAKEPWNRPRNTLDALLLLRAAFLNEQRASAEGVPFDTTTASRA